MGCHPSVTLPSLLDDLDMGVTLHEPESGAILDVNERLEELSGYSTQELLEMGLGEYSAHLSGFSSAEIVHRIRATAEGESQQLQVQLERANGELIWVRVSFDRTTIKDERYVVGTVTDITEYRSQERRLRLLTRVVRHNLRNDMNVLIGHAEELQSTLPEGSGDVRTILDIATDVGTLSKSIQEIEEIASADATQRLPTNLRAVARSLVADKRETYPESELRLDTAEDVWVVGDSGLYYAIDHAIENAIEHNDQATPEVTVSTEREDGHGVVRIADNGPPIPTTEKEVLDERMPTSDTYHGSGVGLWVMKWCVDSLAGELEFAESSPRGNVVSLSIPLADAGQR